MTNPFLGPIRTPDSILRRLRGVFQRRDFTPRVLSTIQPVLDVAQPVDLSGAIRSDVPGEIMGGVPVPTDVEPATSFPFIWTPAGDTTVDILNNVQTIWSIQQPPGNLTVWEILAIDLIFKTGSTLPNNGFMVCQIAPYGDAPASPLNGAAWSVSARGAQYSTSKESGIRITPTDDSDINISITSEFWGMVSDTNRVMKTVRIPPGQFLYPRTDALGGQLRIIWSPGVEVGKKLTQGYGRILLRTVR